ncbi:non-classical export protein 1 [Schizosaccharomyces octosporus yFS286]|uniref:Non-classical export protein 1 n=1 Tax=Schizosaccharomyces octosporus (strain yFS286) TaxID=483514 RepID=S9RFR3_SCHOY|nr:non-classical export protein 1 [Schizosaccharomyces octosporus yFS286]EPX72919.1 non-classical export protein 1 [Schizosaccharomyces octosporus yFS286]
MSQTYLISKLMDPLFGMAIGIYGYYLFEKEHPRPQGKGLQELLMKRWNSRNNGVSSESVQH